MKFWKQQQKKIGEEDIFKEKNMFCINLWHNTLLDI